MGERDVPQKLLAPIVLWSVGKNASRATHATPGQKSKPERLKNHFSEDNSVMSYEFRPGEMVISSILS